MTVYVIQSDCGRFKIGYTAALTPRGRLSELQVGSPRALTCLAYGTGSRDTEQMLHLRLAPERLHGEWFRPSKRLDSLVAYIKEFGSAEGWDFADEHPEDWAAAVAEDGAVAPLVQARKEQLERYHWREGLRREREHPRPRAKQLTVENVEFAWRQSGFADRLALRRVHLVGEYFHSQRVDWVHNGHALKGSGLQYTRNLFDIFEPAKLCWPWLGAIVHDLTRSTETNWYLRQQLNQHEKLISMIRRNVIGGGWHHLSPALPESMSIPQRCLLTWDEFVDMAAKHARLVAVDSHIEYWWPENMVSELKPDHPAVAA